MQNLRSVLRSALLAGLVALASLLPLNAATPLGDVGTPVTAVEAAILTGPADAITVRVTFNDVDDALARLGLDATQHLVNQMNVRRITTNQLVNAILRGAQYHDTATGATVYYLGSLAVIQRAGTHQIDTAYRGRVKNRWQPL